MTSDVSVVERAVGFLAAPPAAVVAGAGAAPACWARPAAAAAAAFLGSRGRGALPAVFDTAPARGPEAASLRPAPGKLALPEAPFEPAPALPAAGWWVNSIRCCTCFTGSYAKPLVSRGGQAIQAPGLGGWHCAHFVHHARLVGTVWAPFTQLHASSHRASYGLRKRQEGEKEPGVGTEQGTRTAGRATGR